MSNQASNERGFSITELIVVIAMIGILSLLAVPSLATYWRTSSLSAGAEQLVSVLNRARHLAIRTNDSVCVERSGTGVRMRTVSCAGTVWTGVGTDGAGLIQIANNLQVERVDGERHLHERGRSQHDGGLHGDEIPTTTHTLTVAVSVTGRVTIQ